MKTQITSLAFFALAGAAFGQTSLVNSSFSQITDVGDGTYNVTADISLAANQEYILEGPTFVQNGATITIGEGAIVRGQPNSALANTEPGMLVITREGKIFAEGTQSNPIIFTTAEASTGGRWSSGAFLDSDPKNNPIPVSVNRWGALCLLGNAPINAGVVDTSKPGEAYIEGITEDSRSLYGGFDANDNSGVLKYVSIRYTGDVIVDGQEIQGLTLGGVGFGTTLEYLEVFGSGDDGIEIFGGTAAVKNLVLYGYDDDGFDGDHGWNGFAQYVLVLNSPAVSADHAIELDGDDTDDFGSDEDNMTPDGRPFASAHLTNFTVIGAAATDDQAVRFRRGFGGSFTNSLIANFPSTAGLRIDNTGGVFNGGTDGPVAFGFPSVKSQDRVTAKTFNLQGLTFYNVNGDTVAGVANSAFEQGVLNNTTGNSIANQVGVNPEFGKEGRNQNGGIAASDITNGTFNPVPVRNTATEGAVDAGANFFDVVDYRGAFEPTSNIELWTTGWTALNKGGIIIDRL